MNNSESLNSIQGGSRVGVFGGTFNPIHNGHINSMETVLKVLDLDSVRVVPAFISPQKKMIQGPSAEQRFELVSRALSQHDEFIVVDDIELERKGVSYSYETISAYVKKWPEVEFYLIVGMDQFENFDRWYKFEKLLELTNLVVTSRPGSTASVDISDFADGVAELVVKLDTDVVTLESGKKIFFVPLEDVDISASEIRRRMREGESVEEYLPQPVSAYLKEEAFYEPLGVKVNDYREFTEVCADLLFSRKALDVQGFDLTKLSQVSEYSLIASGTSVRHTVALSENLVRKIKELYGIYPQNLEGQQEGRWIALDYGSLIVHIFYDYVRLEYQLEKIWESGVNLELKDPYLEKDPQEKLL